MTISRAYDNKSMFNVNLLADVFAFPPLVYNKEESLDISFRFYEGAVIMTVQGDAYVANIASHLSLDDWAFMHGYLIISRGKQRLAFSEERTCMSHTYITHTLF